MTRKVSNAQLRWWFAAYNRKFFDAKLPRPWAIQFDKLRGLKLGTVLFCKNQDMTSPMFLGIDSRLRFSPVLCRLALLHEMVHVKHNDDDHGEMFYAEIQRLFEAGAFDGLI